MTIAIRLIDNVLRCKNKDLMSQENLFYGFVVFSNASFHNAELVKFSCLL